MLVSEAIRFVNGSFPTKPPVTAGTITIKGNNPHLSHLQVYDGDDEEGREVTLGPGKYAATISLPNGHHRHRFETRIHCAPEPEPNAECNLLFTGKIFILARYSKIIQYIFQRSYVKSRGLWKFNNSVRSKSTAYRYMVVCNQTKDRASKSEKKW